MSTLSDLTVEQILKAAEIGTDVLVAVLNYRSKVAGKSVEELLAESRANWEQADRDVDALLDKGHEG